MALEKLEFTKDWNNPEDFPTYEPSESKVRADMQLLYDEIRDYLNGKVAASVDTLENNLENIGNANHSHTNLAVLNLIMGVTQTLGNAADKVPSEKAVSDAIENFSTSAGLGDMLKSIYDPQGKQTDIYKYVADQIAVSAAAANHNHQGQSLNPNSIELTGANSGSNVHGGYVDFHYAKSEKDYTTRIVENEEGVLSAQFDGDSNYYNLLHTGNMTKTGGIINRNLLHNGNFLDPINSRGQTEYTGSGYHVDRWRGGRTTDVTTVTDAGLKISNPHASEYSWARQYLDDYLEHGTYTLSVLVAEVGDAVVYMSNSNGGAVPSTLPLKVGLNTITAEIAADTVNRVQFTIGCGSSVTIAGVKLERGKVQTLAEQDADGNWHLLEQPWDKGLETLRCVTSTADPNDPYANKSGAGGAQIQSISYVGTGVKATSTSPKTMRCNFRPKLVIGLGYVGTKGLYGADDGSDGSITRIPIDMLTSSFQKSDYAPWGSKVFMKFDEATNELAWYSLEDGISKLSCIWNDSSYTYYWLFIG